jgi:hypothetical protein
MALFGRDANGADAYIRASGASGAGDGLVTFHDTFTNDLKYKALDLSASADVIALVATKSLRVMSVTLSADAACNIQFQTGATDNVSGKIYLPVNGTIHLSNQLGLFETDIGEKLNAVITGTANVGISVSYREV